VPLFNPQPIHPYETSVMPGSVAETCHRYTVSNASTPNGGTLYVMSTTLAIGQTVGHLGFCTGSNAAVAPTHWWAAILDNTYTQQAHSADQTNTAIPASTWQNLAMVTPYTASYTGQHYFGLMFTATTTIPNILAPTFSAAAQLITGSGVPTPVLGGLSTTGLTVPGTDGTTVYAAPTSSGPTFYMYASA
jgi:hypothetical protein